VAGDEMDQDIMTYARNKYNLLIGERMAERAKIAVGSAYPMREEKTITIRGRNLVTGLPEGVEVSSIELREALSPSVQTIVDILKDAIDEAPPEIVADLMETGICMAGGGSQLQGLVERLTDELKVRVWLAEDSMTCVARGAGRILEDLEHLKRFLVGLQRGSTSH
jgi:rod shape-determining protein MreB